MQASDASELEHFYSRYRHLSAGKLLLLERLLAQEAIVLRDLIIVPTARSERGPPLSAAQASIFFIEQLRPQRCVFNLPAVVRMKGSLDPSCLTEALQALVARHEVLRLSFHLENGRPVQSAAAQVQVPVLHRSLRDVPEQLRLGAVQEAIAEQVRVPFDLAQAPLLRVTVIDADEQEWYIAFTIHHLIADDWSIRILVRETGKHYHRICSGEPDTMKTLPLQYLDYVQWERDGLRTDNDDLRYWQQQLGGTVPRIALPTDFPRPVKPKNRGAVHDFHLDAALLQQLKLAAQSQQCTLFMVLLLAYQWLIALKSGVCRVPVAVPITCRDRPELENLIGLFSKMLILYTQLDLAQSIQQALQAVREVTLGAYAHRQLPFDELVRSLRRSRGVGDGVMYDVGFQVLDHRSENYDILDLEKEGWPGPRSLPFDLCVDAQVAKCDLFLCAWEYQGRLTCSLEYDVDLYERSTVVQWMQEYQELLHYIAADMNQPLERCSLRSSNVQKQ